MKGKPAPKGKPNTRTQGNTLPGYMSAKGRFKRVCVVSSYRAGTDTKTEKTLKGRSSTRRFAVAFSCPFVRKAPAPRGARPTLRPGRRGGASTVGLDGDTAPRRGGESAGKAGRIVKTSRRNAGIFPYVRACKPSGITALCRLSDNGSYVNFRNISFTFKGIYSDIRL
jgi:hypothetical protein